MISEHENEILTRIGPGTPMGALQRRYWHPIGAVEEMADRRTKRVRLLGEDLVLFKDRDGNLGLVAPSGSGYPVETLGGMIFAYLGPLPAPLLPRWDGFVGERVIRMIGWAQVSCNWLQIMENSLDPVHTEWLHGKFQEFLEEQQGNVYTISRKHLKIDFAEFEYGVYKRRLLAGAREDSDDWRVGHPVLFPNVLAVGSGGGALWKSNTYQMRVPIDDTHSMHYWYQAYEAPAGVDVPRHLLERIPFYEIPLRDASGEYTLNVIDVQDVMAWETQGPIARRHLERLGTTDKGIILYRSMLKRELARIERGEDPMGTIRDPAKNERIPIELERNKAHFLDGFANLVRRTQAQYSPFASDLCELFRAYNDEQLKRRELAAV